MPEHLEYPGQTIRELMEEQGWEISDLAFSLGLTSLDLEFLLEGDLNLDANLASALSKTLGGSLSFWLEKENLYNQALRMYHAR